MPGVDPLDHAATGDPSQPSRDVVLAVTQARDDVTILDAPAVLAEVPRLSQWFIRAALVYLLLGDGDEVILPAPYWVSYPSMAAAAGEPIGVCTGGECQVTDDLTPQDIENLGDRKRALRVEDLGPALVAITLLEFKQLLPPHRPVPIPTSPISKPITRKPNFFTISSTRLTSWAR